MSMRLAVPKGTQHRTKGEFVYRTLRDAIVKCELPPGERLVIDDLARRLQVSSIPVREALQLLQSEGLVLMVPHVGATVAPISHESVTEVFTVMEGLESVAARAAAERARPEDLDALEEHRRGHGPRAGHGRARAVGGAQHPLPRRPSAGSPRMPMLQEMMERVLDRWDRVRRFFFAGVLVHRAQQAQQEHHDPAGRDEGARTGPGWRRRSASTTAGRSPTTRAFLEPASPPPPPRATGEDVRLRRVTAASPPGPAYTRVATLRTPEALRAHLGRIRASRSGSTTSSSPGASSPLGRPIEVDGVRVGNRFCILPMEGWDGTRDGAPERADASGAGGTSG